MVTERVSCQIPMMWDIYSERDKNHERVWKSPKQKAEGQLNKKEGKEVFPFEAKASMETQVMLGFKMLYSGYWGSPQMPTQSS